MGRNLTVRLVAPVLGGLAVRPAPGLVEYDFGQWDALTPAELAHVGERVVILSHGLALAAGLALLLDRDPLRAERYTLDNGGMAELAMSLSLNLVRIDPVIACATADTR